MKKQVTFIFATLSVLTVLVLIASLPSVKADAFTLKEKITTNVVCPSSTILLQHIVEAEESGPFTVAVSGTASRFSTTVPSGFWLGEGQSKTIYTYITPSSKISPGTYDIKITVESNGLVKESEHDIIVENCHHAALDISPSEQTICACEEKTMTLEVTNNGKYLETYYLDVEGPASKWITLSSRTVSLAADSSTTVDAYINTPCEVKGNYELNFVAAAPPYTKTNKKTSIEVVHCYDYTIDSDKTLYDLCEAEELNIPITIKNLGTSENVYAINIEAPDWVKADQRDLKIAEGEEKNFNLVAKPPYGTEGNFSVLIEVLSELGDVLKKHSLELDVEGCYSVDVSIEEESDRICNALSNSYSVIIRNTGKFKNSFDLNIEGPEWATLSNEHVTLNSSEEILVDLKVKPPFEAAAAINNITVKAVEKESGVEASDMISLETISVEDCYKPAISSQNDNITISRDSTATIPIIIENKGTNEANYSIELSGTAASFCQINPGAITVKAEEAQTVYLYIAPPLETQIDDYIVTITARLVDTTILASKAITISVTEAAEEPEMQMSENITNATNITNITNVSSEITGEAIEAEEARPEARPSIWSKFVAWLARLFRPGAGGEAITNISDLDVSNITDTNITTNITTGENNAPVLIGDIPDIEIEQDGEYELDLADYFEDPDNDSLTYVVVKPRHIAIETEGSKVTIKPESSFIGMAKITFSAYDGKTITASNEVEIKVGMPEETKPPATNESNNETGNETGNETNQAE